MLQSLIHHKLGRAISEGYFNPNEDTLTSSSIGLLQYLKDEEIWKILKDSCGMISDETFPQKPGASLSFAFWPSLCSDGKTNDRRVEPDVWIEFEKIHVLIEAKKSDKPFGYSQYKEQWEKEIRSIKLEIEDNGKPIILIALGGNGKLSDDTLCVDGKDYNIYTASWYNFIHSLIELKNHFVSINAPQNEIRVINDCISGLNIHGYFNSIWLDSILHSRINKSASEYIKDSFDYADNLPIMNGLDKVICLKSINFNEIWKIQK